MRFFVLIVFFFGNLLISKSQTNPLLKGPINSNFQRFWYSDSVNHTAFYPTFLKLKLDSSNGNSLSSNLIQKIWFHKKNKNKSSLIINPSFELSLEYQNENNELISGQGLGLNILGEFHSKINVGFSFLNYHSKFVNYRREFILENRVSPGVGVHKGVDVLSSNYMSAYLNYKAKKYFDFEVGYGRQFIGDGYRSLLLSDASNASPYFKITTKFWRIKYTNLFASHQNIYGVENKSTLFSRKYTATHYLDWEITEWLNLGLFETIVWQDDEGTYKRGYDPNYLNPIIFYRPVEFSIGSSDNAIVGSNLKFSLPRDHIIYFQTVLDEFLLAELQADFNQLRNPYQDIRSGWWANKYGFQLGWRKFNLFKIKGLDARLEYNMVRPFTYAHSSPSQAYSNYNISLSHPLGANFEEYLIILNYRKSKWLGRVHVNYFKKGLSMPGENLGENLELSNVSRDKEYENFITQGVLNEVVYIDANIGYLVQEKWNSTISLGISSRTSQLENAENVNQFVYVSLKSNLFNRYFDY